MSNSQQHREMMEREIALATRKPRSNWPHRWNAKVNYKFIVGDDYDLLNAQVDSKVVTQHQMQIHENFYARVQGLYMAKEHVAKSQISPSVLYLLDDKNRVAFGSQSGSAL